MLVGFPAVAVACQSGLLDSHQRPFFKQFHPDLLIEPWTRNFWTYPLAFVPFYLFIVFMMVGSSNAVNLTDGLDGLAIRPDGHRFGGHDGPDICFEPTPNLSRYLGLAHLPRIRRS